MRSAIAAVCVAGFMTLASGGALSAPVLDQDQSLSAMSSFSGTGNILIQSFRQVADTLTGVAVMFDGSGTASAQVLEILDNLPGNGGAILASATANSPVASGIPAFVFFDFATISVVPETELFFRIQPDAGAGGRTLAGAGDVYTRGQFYSLNGSLSFPQFDLTFRTFSDGVAAVPAPPQPVLFGLTAMLVAFQISRSRRRPQPAGRFRHARQVLIPRSRRSGR